MKNNMKLSIDITFTADQGVHDETAFRAAVYHAIAAMRNDAAANGIAHMNERITVKGTNFAGIVHNKYGSFDMGAAIAGFED